MEAKPSLPPSAVVITVKYGTVSSDASATHVVVSTSYPTPTCLELCVTKDTASPDCPVSDCRVVNYQQAREAIAAFFQQVIDTVPPKTEVCTLVKSFLLERLLSDNVFDLMEVSLSPSPTQQVFPRRSFRKLLDMSQRVVARFLDEEKKLPVSMDNHPIKYTKSQVMPGYSKVKSSIGTQGHRQMLLEILAKMQDAMTPINFPPEEQVSLPKYADSDAAFMDFLWNGEAANMNKRVDLRANGP